MKFFIFENKRILKLLQHCNIQSNKISVHYNNYAKLMHAKARVSPSILNIDIIYVKEYLYNFNKNFLILFATIFSFK